MGLSKRRKLSNAIDEILWNEHIKLHPPEPPLAWRTEELAAMDNMQAAYDTIMRSGAQNISAVFELLKYSYVCPASVRLVGVKREADRYQKLVREATKEQAWQRLQRNLSGFASELYALRRSRDLGGTKVQ